MGWGNRKVRGSGRRNLAKQQDDPAPIPERLTEAVSRATCPSPCWALRERGRRRPSADALSPFQTMLDGVSRPCWDSSPKKITIFCQTCTFKLESQSHFLPIIGITVTNPRLYLINKRFQLRIMNDSDQSANVP